MGIGMTIKRVFVASWRDAHKWASMRFKALAAGLAALQVAWPNIPGAWKDQLPPAVPHYLGYAVMASIGAAAYTQVTRKASKP